MNWFETIAGCSEKSVEFVHEQLSVDGEWLRSSGNGGEWRCGTLEVPSLAELRERAGNLETPAGLRTSIREVVADVQQLHRDPASVGALFQVASQFNLLEMISPDVCPEDGVGRYERDFTQGPACAIAAGAGTIYRNYFVPLDGQVGQTVDRQIDCLADVGAWLGNADDSLWDMRNGYALASRAGLKVIRERLGELDEATRDELRGLLRIGLQRDTQVTLDDCSHVVTQAYCSALPVAYGWPSADEWAPFAKLVLEAAYEATLCAAVENAVRTGSHQVYLTLLGGGAFGNRMEWISDAIYRAVQRHAACGLEIAVVSYGRSSSEVRGLVERIEKTLM